LCQNVARLVVIALLILFAIYYSPPRLLMDSPGKPSRGDAPIFYAKVVINVALVLIASLYGWILGMFHHATGRDPTTISHAVSRVYDALNGRLLGLRVHVLSRSKLADTTPWAVVVCNHQSFVDVRCVAAVWRPKMVIMAKESLRYYPVLGWFMR
jgi:lysophosphatidate acyltransferase